MKVFIVIVSIVMTGSSAFADADYNIAGKRGYALWNCASLGMIAEHAVEEIEPLFAEGHALLSEIVDAWRSGALTDENASEVPIGIRWYLVGGPTVEFSLGYMWAQFVENADDKTFPKGIEGSLDQKETLQKAKAELAFRDKNCLLLVDE